MGIINDNALTFSHFQNSEDKSNKTIVQYVTFLIMHLSLQLMVLFEVLVYFPEIFHICLDIFTFSARVIIVF